MGGDVLDREPLAKRTAADLERTTGLDPGTPTLEGHVPGADEGTEPATLTLAR